MPLPYGRLWDFPQLIPRLLRGLWREEGTLRQKAMRGGVWVLASMGLTNTLGMVRTIILVRLLVPQDFGIMSIAGFMLAAVAAFTQTGMATAIVQRKHVDQTTLNAAWIIQILRSLLVFLVVFLLAPWAARFYENPAICPILRLVSLTLLFAGFSNIGLSLLTKELQFRRLALFSVSIEAVSFVFTVAVALWLRSVWAIAIGWVGNSFAYLVGSYIVHPYRPRFATHWREGKQLLSFGVNLTGKGILGFLGSQGDSAVVGKVVGMAGLGLYSLANRLSNLPSDCIAQVLADVALPAYAKLQDDAERLGNAFAVGMRAVIVLAVPASVGLFVLAPDLVQVIYGDRYMPMVTCFRVLAISNLLRCVAGIVGPVFLGVGQPGVSLFFQFIRFATFAVAIYPCTKAWGITGAAVAMVLSMVTSTTWALWRVRSVVGSGALAQCGRDFAYVVGVVSIMAIAVLSVHVTGFSRSPFGLLATVACGFVVYAGAVLLLWPGMGKDARAWASEAMR
jgi:O-antigen/teichoic acid export membrane protein